MKNRLSISLLFLIILLVGVFANDALAVPVTFTKLTGITGGSPAATAVYRGELSSIGDVASISILDNSSNLSGSPGQFSGFDLDSIKLSLTSVGTASDAASLIGLSVFDFSTSGTFFTPGVQTAPTDPKLFGTGVSGNTVDNSIATLGLFDGNSTTAIPGADGFISLGVGGFLAFNLTSLLSTTAPVYLYIGEVGDNGEVAAGTIDVSSSPVPEPTTVLLLGAGLIGLVGYGRKKMT